MRQTNKVIEYRNRTLNFTKQEEALLIQIIEKHEDVIECKKTDSESNRLKSSIWKKIEKEFNSSPVCNTYRLSTILKTKYKNLKKRRRDAGRDPTLQIEFNDEEFTTANNIVGSWIKNELPDESDDLKKEDDISMEAAKDDSEDFKNIIVSDDLLVQLDGSYDDEDQSDHENINTEINDPCISERVKRKQQWDRQTGPVLRTKISDPLQHATERTNIKKKRRLRPDNLTKWLERGRATRNEGRATSNEGRATLNEGRPTLNELEEKFLREKHELSQKLKIEEHNAKMKRDERLGELKEEETKLKIDCLKEELAIRKLQKAKLLEDEIKPLN